MTERYVVTVDGLAGSGKTVLSKLLAERLGWVRFYSGGLYRSIALAALKSGVLPTERPRVREFLEAQQVEILAADPHEAKVLISGVVFGDELYTPKVSEATSIISSYEEVRELVVKTQRESLLEHSLVAEGRDMGTVIFPDALVKFFIEASVEERVRRRLEQLYSKEELESEEGVEKRRKEIEIEVIERDKRDSERPIAPTVAASDAIVVDNSGRTLTEVVETMYDSVSCKLGLS